MPARARTLAISTVVLAAIGASGVAVAQATDHGSHGRSAVSSTADHHADAADDVVTGAVADQARRAATKAAGGGKAGDVERETEGSVITYEVEVNKAGQTVDVELDQQFRVVSTDNESDTDKGDQDSADSDDHDHAASDDGGQGED